MCIVVKNIVCHYCKPKRYVFVPQRWQMQAWPRSATGTRARAAASIGCAWHQQRVLKLPACAGAQPFGPPHRGQWCAGRGRVLVLADIAYCTQDGLAVTAGRQRRRIAAFAGPVT